MYGYLCSMYNYVIIIRHHIESKNRISLKLCGSFTRIFRQFRLSEFTLSVNFDTAGNNLSPAQKHRLLTTPLPKIDLLRQLNPLNNDYAGTDTF